MFTFVGIFKSLNERIDPYFVVSLSLVFFEVSIHGLAEITRILSTGFLIRFVLLLEFGSFFLCQRVKSILNRVLSSARDAFSDFAPFISKILLFHEERDVFPLSPGVPSFLIKAYHLIAGFTWLYQRYRHCLPYRVGPTF